MQKNLYIISGCNGAGGRLGQPVDIKNKELYDTIIAYVR